jgi:aspartate racemase
MGLTLSLLGTKYLIESDLYWPHLERAEIRVVKPTRSQAEELRAMVFEELIQGMVPETSRATLQEMAGDCRNRGGEVAGLCCTELGMFFGDEEAPWRLVNFTEAHVKAVSSN